MSSTAIFVLPAAATFLVAALLFARAKKQPEHARVLTAIGGLLFVIALVLLGLGFYRLFTASAA